MALGPVKRMIDKMLGKVEAKLNNLARKAVLDLANDAGTFQALQLKVLGDSVRDRVEHLQEYGFTSVPTEGECVLLQVGGDPDHLVALGLGDRSSRPKGLAPGETQVYSKFGQHLHFKADGSVVAQNGAGNGKLEINAAGKVTITAATTIELGAGATEALVKGDAFRTLFNAHTHSYLPGTLGATPTATPLPQMDTVPYDHTSNKVKTT